MSLLLKKLLSHLPSKLPVGMAELDAFIDDVISLAGQYADRDSMGFAIASMIMHLPSNKGSAPKSFFVNGLRKAAANQVSSQFFQNIKTKQAEAQLAAQKAAEEATKNQAEDTAPTTAVSLDEKA